MDFDCRVIFTCVWAEKFNYIRKWKRGNVWRIARKSISWTSPNFTFKCNPASYLVSILFTRVKFYVYLHARENYASTLHAGAKRKAWKKIQAGIEFKLLTSAIPVQRSKQQSKQANWELVIIKIDYSLGLNLSQKLVISELSLSKWGWVQNLSCEKTFICMRIKNHFHIALSLAWK